MIINQPLGKPKHDPMLCTTCRFCSANGNCFVKSCKNNDSWKPKGVELGLPHGILPADPFAQAQNYYSWTISSDSTAPQSIYWTKSDINIAQGGYANEIVSAM